jgi:hypothetical protein
MNHQSLEIPVTHSSLAALLLPATLCLAQAPAAGTLMLEGTRVSLPFALALQRDNAEGLLDQAQELRILLTDKPVDLVRLQGITPVFDLAPGVAAGEFKGILLRMDPAKPTAVIVTLLAPPKAQGQSLTNLTLSKIPDGPFSRFSLQAGKVSGALDHPVEEGSEDMPSFGFNVAFDLPVGKAPAITEDLKGKAAAAHPALAALRQRAQCLAKGDIEGAMTYSAPSALARDRAFLSQGGAEAKAMLPAMGKQLVKELARVQRLIVRGERATALFPDNNSFQLRKVAGAWKVE